LNSDFVEGAIGELQIMPAFLDLAKETLAVSMNFMLSVFDA
jgi:hypothetical protein